jgi:bacterioferritin-associated ferredoxin
VLICHCKRITDQDLRRAVREGARTAGMAAHLSGAGTGCGSCIPLIREVVQAELLALVVPSPAPPLTAAAALR